MKRGFGLVEVLIALMILTVVMVAVTRMYIASSRANTYAENLTYASALGHSRLISLKTLAYEAPDLNTGWRKDPGNPLREMGRKFYIFWSVETRESGKAIVVYTAWDDQAPAQDFGSAQALLASGCAHREFAGYVSNPSGN